MKAVCALPEPTLVLLTGRYALPELAGCGLRECSLGGAPLGDVLRRMNRLEWALACAPDRRAEGATLNNLSQVFQARGDNETAQRYLEQSLPIRREIGDKAGMVATLHNLAHMALQRDDNQSAAERWSEAWGQAQETKHAQGLFHVARGFGDLLARAGHREQGAQLLRVALQVGHAAGFPGTAAIEAKLRVCPL